MKSFRRLFDQSFAPCWSAILQHLTQISGCSGASHHLSSLSWSSRRLYRLPSFALSPPPAAYRCWSVVMEGRSPATSAAALGRWAQASAASIALQLACSPSILNSIQAARLGVSWKHRLEASVAENYSPAGKLVSCRRRLAEIRRVRHQRKEYWRHYQ